MGKIHRYIEKGGVYFITTNTYNRKEIFNDVESAKFMLMCIGYHRYMLNFNLFGYVIMPDHIHLLLQPYDEKNNISKIMKDIKGNFSRRYNEKINDGSRQLIAGYKKDADGRVYSPVWQEGFWDTGLRDEKQVREKIEYMHWNPVKKGLAEHPKDYEFSSYHRYCHQKRICAQISIDPII